MVQQLTTAQAAYLAGAIDGEGCITIRRETPRAASGRLSPQYQFVVKLTNTNKAWIEELQRWAGGMVRQLNSHGARNRKVCWDLRFRAGEARTVLSQAMPYLLIKRRQAELMLRYFELSGRRRNESKPRVPVAPDIIAAQEALYEEYKALNHRGVVRSANLRGAPSDRACSIDDCTNKHYGRGYCLKHYHKYVARGGPRAYEKACAICGRPFTARRKDTECCSIVCSNRKYYQENTAHVKALVAARRKRLKTLTE